MAISEGTVVVGANYWDAAYVYVREGIAWSAQAKLVASDGVLGLFG